VIPSSKIAAAALTWGDAMTVPQSCSTMSETLRVEMPLTYIHPGGSVGSL
jgi:hypothetical protein